MVGNKNPNNLSNKEWEEFAAMTTMRINSQVRQFGGFAPGKRVFGRTPKMPIWDIGNPFFEDFTNPVEAPATTAHGLLSVMRKIRQASLNADFSNKLSTALTRMVRKNKSEEFFLGQTVFFIAANRTEKGGEMVRTRDNYWALWGGNMRWFALGDHTWRRIWAICVQLIAYLS